MAEPPMLERFVLVTGDPQERISRAVETAAADLSPRLPSLPSAARIEGGRTVGAIGLDSGY